MYLEVKGERWQEYATSEFQWAIKKLAICWLHSRGFLKYF